MIADHLQGLEKFESGLWKIADNLRANSNLASNEYFMPIMGLIFLRHATNRFYEAKAAIEADKKAGKMPDRPLVEADFTRRRALNLPEGSRFDVILKSPKDGNLGAALTAAMEAIEAAFPPLAGQLPKDYGRFEGSVLEEMMRMFDSEGLRSASGDVFGRIYEYFLAEFSKQGAHDGGEFFTPPSIVQTIVNVIEPDHGVILDPACGSGGMFVQSSHFIEDAGQDTMKRVTFYGHEKNETTAKLAQINLAVHGLQGTIRAGNEAITYYKDPHELVGKCDFVMANPPFNVDEVDAEKVKGDKRLPFGLPGVNKSKKVSNANYLWLSYFYSYLNDKGRAGVVMSSQASSAGRDEATVRQKLVETGAVDVMIDIRGNFFYTRTVPCQLWFFDRAKEKDAARRDHVLMLDARQIFRKVSRSVCDFSPEQQNNIAAIVWLYRGQQERFLKLVESYLMQAVDLGEKAKVPLAVYEEALGKLADLMGPFVKVKREGDPLAGPWDELTSAQAFVKFLGEGDNRVPLSFATIEEVERAGCHWAVAYPASRRPSGVKDDAIIFIARLTENPNDIRIFGRALGMKHQPGRDDATEADIARRSWKSKWPRYVRVHHAEFVAGTMSNGVSLNELMDTLGPNSFLPTQRNSERGEGNIDPRKAYRQQAAVELSREASLWLGEGLQRAFDEHGNVPQDTLDRLDWPELPTAPLSGGGG